MAGIGIAKRGLGLLAKGGRAGFKKGKAVTKADLAKRDLWTKRELKRRSKIGQRKSKWDIKGAISGHPLNPLRIHAAEKATDWSSKRKNVYTRTRDDLKKSRDPKLQGIGEAFQKMDYKDKAKGTYKEKDYEPKLTKRTHVGRKTGGRIGFKKAGPVSPINIPWPKPGEIPSQKRKGKAKGGRIGLQFGGPPSIDAKKIAKEKKREEYYKKHGRPGEFEKAARKQSESRKRRTHLGVIRNKGGKV